jgi:hypothetical protein
MRSEYRSKRTICCEILFFFSGRIYRFKMPQIYFLCCIGDVDSIIFQNRVFWVTPRRHVPIDPYSIHTIFTGDVIYSARLDKQSNFILPICLKVTSLLLLHYSNRIRDEFANGATGASFGQTRHGTCATSEKCHSSQEYIKILHKMRIITSGQPRFLRTSSLDRCVSR